MNVVNISIDDISPHPRSSTRVLESCRQILNLFPEAKFSLFIPLSYWRTKGETATPTPFPIDQYPDFCDELARLPQQNFELCYHGLLHGIPGVTNNDEFRTLSRADTLEKLAQMQGIAKRSGLRFRKIFRPPAWHMSAEAIRACVEWGMELLSLAPETEVRTEYGGADESAPTVSFYNVCPPWKPLQLFAKTSLVYHACEWSPNYLGETLTGELMNFLELKRRDYAFSFIADTAGPLAECQKEAV